MWQSRDSSFPRALFHHEPSSPAKSATPMVAVVGDGGGGDCQYNQSSDSLRDSLSYFIKGRKDNGGHWVKGRWHLTFRGCLRCAGSVISTLPNGIDTDIPVLPVGTLGNTELSHRAKVRWLVNSRDGPWTQRIWLPTLPLKSTAPQGGLRKARLTNPHSAKF